MLNTSRENFQTIKKLYTYPYIDESCEYIRNNFTEKGGDFSIFDMLSKLDTMVILYDDKKPGNTRYISFSGDAEKNYLILDANRKVEELRFDAACMLGRIIRKVVDTKGNLCPNYTTVSKNFSREEKHFALALLVPTHELIKFITQKDENGNYLYLDENNEIDFKHINAVADHFGVPFDQCLSRMFHVFEELRESKSKYDFHIKDCYVKSDYQKKKKEYSQEQREKDMKEVVPNHKQNRAKLVNHLIDSLHYRSWSRLSDIAKRRLLINLVKADSVNEGVVKSEEEAKAIINNYIASGGTIYDGHLITKDGSYELSDDSLVVLGEYELYAKTLERGLITGIAKSNPQLGYIVNLDYKEALSCIKERDLTRYICDLHERLFTKLSHKYGEQRGGFFRNANVSLAGTDVKTASPRMIPQLMDNVSWRILDTLKQNSEGKLSNSEYIDKINECIYEIIRMQPFADGNKRTSRLLSNILYQEKGLPYVFVPVKDWDNYVDAWSSNNIDDYNEMMHNLIVDSYQYFYGDQTVTEITNSKTYGKNIIMANRKQK